MKVKLPGAFGLLVRRCGWVRVTDVAKCRCQELGPAARPCPSRAFVDARSGVAPAPTFGRAGLPVGDEASVGGFGLSASSLLGGVGAWCSRPGRRWGRAWRAGRRRRARCGAACVGRGGALEGVVLAAGEQVPGEHGELARDRDRGDLAVRGERRRAARRRATVRGSCAAAQAASASTWRAAAEPSLADPAVARGRRCRTGGPSGAGRGSRRAGGGREAADVADHGDQRGGGDRCRSRGSSSVAARPRRRGRGARSARRSCASSPARKSSWRRHASTVSRSSSGSSSVGEPGAALGPERVAGRRARRERAHQRGADLVLERGAPLDQRATLRDLPTQRARCARHRSRSPAGQSPASNSASTRASIWSVLTLRLGDRAHLARVREHDPRDVRLEDPRDRQRVAGRLHRHLIVRGQAAARTAPASAASLAIRPAAAPCRPRRSRPRRSRDARLTRSTAPPPPFTS